MHVFFTFVSTSKLHLQQVRGASSTTSTTTHTNATTDSMPLALPWTGPAWLLHRVPFCFAFAPCLSFCILPLPAWLLHHVCLSTALCLTRPVRLGAVITDSNPRPFPQVIHPDLEEQIVLLSGQRQARAGGAALFIPTLHTRSQYNTSMVHITMHLLH